MTRDRGSYGPLDRERHWAVGWATDEAVGYARDKTVGAALRPAMPAIEDVFAAGRGARRLWTASRGISGRVGAERPAVQIVQLGQDLFHTPADRDRAIAQLSTGFRSLANDLAVWLSSNEEHPDATKTAQWIASDVTPTLEEWKAFVTREQKSWWTKVATSWQTFEGWWDRLKQLRSIARSHGVQLQSAEPMPLPKTIWQHSAEGTGSEATAILGVLKIGAFAALGIMGAAGLYAAIRNLGARARLSDDRQAIKEIVRDEIKTARTR